MQYETPPNGWRTFLILWCTQSLSVIGSALTFFAINIWVVQVLYPRPEQKPALAIALSAMTLAFGIPTMIFAPIAGAWADRHDRKLTIMLSDLGSGLLSVLLIALILSQTLQLWSLLVVLVLAAIFNTFHDSAFDTSYAMLVPEERLPRANGMMQTIFSLSGIFSPPLAAMMIGLPALARQGYSSIPFGASIAWLQDGTVLAIGVDVLTFMIASATLLFLHVPSPKRADLLVEAGQSRPSMWDDVKEGARYIWQRRPMLWLLGTFTVANFVGAPLAVLEPLIVKFNLAADWAARGYTYETAIALLGSVTGIGGLLGGIVMSTWGGLRRRRVYGVLLPMIISGSAMIAIGFSPLLYVTAALIGVNIGMIPLMNAHSQAIWQTQTPRELQGRVFAVRRVIAQFTFPLGTAFAGLAGFFNVGTMFVVLGALLVLFCTAQFFNPSLLRVEDKVYLDQLAASPEDVAPVA
ncbi:MAG TPA: MFS transporter [Herpetosiphonaceae bacterium]